MKPTAVLIVLVLALGCAEKADKSVMDTPPSGGSNPDAPSAALPQPGDPEELLVEVNGVEFTLGDVAVPFGMQMKAAASRTKPGQEETIRTRILGNLAEQYVLRTLLLQEADKAGVTVTKEDEEAALEKIKARMPPGKTVEEFMEKSVVGKEKMRQELLDGIRVNKFLELQLADSREVTDKEIDEFMEARKDVLATPETARARHILLSAKADEDEAVKAQQRKRAEEIREKLVAGADFAALAREHSDCPSSKKGGDLGSFRRGQMVKPFEEAAFSQEIDAIGPVIETKFGYHIIKVLERKEAGTLSRETVADLIKSRKSRSAMQRYLDQLRREAKITYGPLLTAAAAKRSEPAVLAMTAPASDAVPEAGAAE
jgi:peptidyl-prolyl cis-trans isomerase C